MKYKMIPIVLILFPMILFVGATQIYANGINPFSLVTALDVEVSGAGTGNGTFGLSDFYDIAWNTGGTTLDLSTDLVGQTTFHGPWGVPCPGGDCFNDFNLFSSTMNVPDGTWFFTLTTWDDEDPLHMALTSMMATAIPLAGNPVTFNFAFSGASFDNSATAVGSITFSNVDLINPFPAIPEPTSLLLLGTGLGVLGLAAYRRRRK